MSRSASSPSPALSSRPSSPPPTTSRSSTSSPSVQLKPGTKLYDAVAAGAELAGTEGARSLLVLSDGADTGSISTIDELSDSAAESGVVVDVVALAQSAEQQATLDELASAAGGQVIPADPDALDAVFSAQADALASQVLVTFDLPPGVSGEQTVETSLAAGGNTFTDSAFVTLTGIDVGCCRAEDHRARGAAHRSDRLHCSARWRSDSGSRACWPSPWVAGRPRR